MSLTETDGGVTQAVVCNLLQGLEKREHNVYMDNYYSSPALYKLLLMKSFGAYGTVIVNRKGMPDEWKSCKGKKRRKVTIMKKAEVRSVNLQNGLLALQWKDKRLVTMLSTIHNTDMVSKTRRIRQATGGIQEIQKPKMIDEYNNYMGGVDKGDQLLSYYGFNHRTVKWWKRAAFQLIDISIVNSYIMYRQSKQECYLNHEQFRIRLAEELLSVGTAPNETPRHARTTPLPPASRLTERHFPSKISLNPNEKQPQYDCHV